MSETNLLNPDALRAILKRCMSHRVSWQEVDLAKDHIAALEADRDKWKRRAEAVLKQAKAFEADNAAIEADNAALVEHVKASAEAGCEESGAYECGTCMSCLARELVSEPHPGVVLLEAHRKALVRARNEGLEKARRMVHNVGLANLALVIDAAKEPEE